ncbi:MAG: hypothetical protein ACOX6D_00405 [Thermoguttaceae bacterium]
MTEKTEEKPRNVEYRASDAQKAETSSNKAPQTFLIGDGPNTFPRKEINAELEKQNERENQRDKLDDHVGPKGAG